LARELDLVQRSVTSNERNRPWEGTILRYGAEIDSDSFATAKAAGPSIRPGVIENYRLATRLGSQLRRNAIHRCQWCLARPKIRATGEL
jgi:hypothetical protein